MAGFLNINITRDEQNNSLTMTQIGLIERILSVMSMEDCNHKYNTADKDPLCKNIDGGPCCEGWDYSSIVGILLYLTGSTRPDISYAVHQCTRFSHSPKRSHELGVKYIARYLKKTEEIIMNPDRKKMRIKMFADADFAGLCTTEDKMNPVSVKSRSEVLLTLRNVPILWSYKLQTENSLSTLEAKYISLSQGIRDLVWARRLMAELGKRMNYKLEKYSDVSKVWEDNTGTQNLDNSKGPLMKARKKHIGIKYHWFR